MLLLERPLLYLRRMLKDKLLVTQDVITAQAYATAKLEWLIK
jgi:hypothetical protein